MITSNLRAGLFGVLTLWLIAAGQESGAQNSFNLDLGQSRSPTTIAEANGMLPERTAAAIAFSAAEPLTDIGSEHRIMARLAYLDYFRNDLDTGLRMRAEANNALLGRRVTREVGTDIGDVEVLGLTLARRHGDYDMELTEYTRIYCKYSDVMPTNVRDHIVNNLLTIRGPFTPEYLTLTVHVLGFDIQVPVPETENHIMMIYSARYLANQILHDRTGDAAYDNTRNGMNDWMLQLLSSFLRFDFIEYNSRPYQAFTMSALLNLYSFSRDPKVKEAARMVLDYMSAKVAVSSNDARRAVPFRRLSTDYCPGLLACDEHGPDSQTPLYMALSGVIDMLPTRPIFGGEIRLAPDGYAGDFARAGLSEYRIPQMIHDLFINRAHRQFYQRIAPNGMAAYFGSPSFLISAGGVPEGAAYTVDLGLLGRYYSSKDLGMVLPTTLMPTGFGASITDLIRFESATTLAKNNVPYDTPTYLLFANTVNMGVAPNFACGLLPQVPGHYKSAPNAYHEVPTDGGKWLFVNRAGVYAHKAPYGYYIALYRGNRALESNCVTILPEVELCATRIVTSVPDAFGFLEVFDTYLNQNLTFDQFMAGVLARNGSLDYYMNTPNTYITASGVSIQFVCQSTNLQANIIAISDDSPLPFPFGGLTSGNIINSDGLGMITIDNPALGRRLRLDLHTAVQTPRRFEEISGAEQWLDWGYVGPETGAYAKPFNTLEEAVGAMPVGGILKIRPGSRAGPYAITKAMTLTAPETFPGGVVVLGR